MVEACDTLTLLNCVRASAAANWRVMYNLHIVIYNYIAILPEFKKHGIVSMKIMGMLNTLMPLMYMYFIHACMHACMHACIHA